MKEELQVRIPNYTTRFGFGLHSGWAIEGAIGSALKIDPSYLSPNVKWSERLEGATKIYGVLLLMTDSFYDLLSPPVQKLCRKVCDGLRRWPPHSCALQSHPDVAATLRLCLSAGCWLRRARVDARPARRSTRSRCQTARLPSTSSRTTQWPSRSMTPR